MVFNLNYGPFGNGSFHEAQRACLQEYRLQNDAVYPGCPQFLQYKDLIAADHGLAAPHSEPELQEIWRRFCSMQSLQVKGTCVKLMRWFSFFEAWQAFKPDFWSRKLLLQIYMKNRMQTLRQIKHAAGRRKLARSLPSLQRRSLQT